MLWEVSTRYLGQAAAASHPLCQVLLDCLTLPEEAAVRRSEDCSHLPRSNQAVVRNQERFTIRSSFLKGPTGKNAWKEFFLPAIHGCSKSYTSCTYLDLLPSLLPFCHQEVTDWRTAYTGVDAQIFAEIQKGSTKYLGSKLDMQRSGLLRIGERWGKNCLNLYLSCVNSLQFWE